MTTADTAPGNWPDPARPGVPANPKRDGWHWVRWPLGGELTCQFWRRFCLSNGRGWAEWREGRLAARYYYAGPCLTPAEVRALTDAAYQRGQEDMRERAAEVADELEDSSDGQVIGANISNLTIKETAP